MEIGWQVELPRHVLKLYEIRETRELIYECLACGRRDERVRMKDGCPRSAGLDARSDFAAQVAEIERLITERLRFDAESQQGGSPVAIGREPVPAALARMS